MPTRFSFLRRPGRPTDDLGLGVKAGVARAVNKDGSFNVTRTGLAWFRPYELYHQLITMPLPRFAGVLLLGYVAANALFASVYLAIGMAHFARPGGEGLAHPMLDALFFSAQTLTTVGYGHIYPLSPLASTVAAVESMVGLLGFALACGLLYGRFSRPHARILFTRHGVIAPYQGQSAFMFRLVNERSNQLIEVEASVTLSMLTGEGGDRTYAPLALERARINLFPTTWTVVHPIEVQSPLRGMTEADLREAGAEFIVLIKAFDDTFAQTVYARSSYKAEEVVWGARFQSMITGTEAGRAVLDLRRLDAMEAAELPDPCAQTPATDP